MMKDHDPCDPNARVTGIIIVKSKIIRMNYWQKTVRRYRHSCQLLYQCSTLQLVVDRTMSGLYLRSGFLTFVHKFALTS
jgi:hypothetical protein